MVSDLHGLRINRAIGRIKTVPNFWVSFNFGLMALVGILLIWYAMTVNYLAASGYQEEILKAKLQLISEQNIQLTGQKERSLSLSVLSNFARKTGLVEASNPLYILEKSGLAQRQP